MRALLRFLAINGKETNDPQGIDVVGGFIRGEIRGRLGWASHVRIRVLEQ